MKKDLLKLLDLTSEEILEILNVADTLKSLKKRGIQHPFLAGKTLAMIFEKNTSDLQGVCKLGLIKIRRRRLSQREWSAVCNAAEGPVVN